MSISSRIEQIRLEKEGNTYDYLSEKYGVNKYYLWMICKYENYYPPARVCEALGIPPRFPVLCAAPISLEDVLIPRNAQVRECVRCGRDYLWVHPRMKYCQECER